MCALDRVLWQQSTVISLIYQQENCGKLALDVYTHCYYSQVQNKQREMSLLMGNLGKFSWETVTLDQGTPSLFTFYPY